MGEAVKAVSALSQGVAGRLEAVRRGDRREGVLQVVRARQGEPLGWQHGAGATPHLRDDLSVLDPAPPATRPRRENGDAPRRVGDAGGDGVVGVDDRRVLRPLVREEALLRGARTPRGSR